MHSSNDSWTVGRLRKLLRYVVLTIFCSTIVAISFGCSGTSLLEKNYVLTIIQTGEGSYSLSPTPGPEGKYKSGTTVTVNAQPAAGWEAASAVSGVTMDSDKQVALVFVVKRFNLSVTKSGEGTVEVSPQPGPDGKYGLGTIVTLKVAPARGFELSSPIPPITMDSNKQIAVKFSPRRLTLKVTTHGQGTYSLAPPPDPDGRYAFGTVVIINTSPGNGWELSGNVPATTMDADKQITVTFASKRLTLTVSQKGKGTYTLSPSPGADGTYPYGTVVRVNTSPAPGYRLVGPMPPVAMDSNKQVNVNFVLLPPAVVTENFNIGTGSGGRALELVAGQRVEGRYSVAGADVTYEVLDPGRNRVASSTRKSKQGTLAFVAARSGKYTILFSSAGILTSSVITLDMTIHYAE